MCGHPLPDEERCNARRIGRGEAGAAPCSRAAAEGQRSHLHARRDHVDIGAVIGELGERVVLLPPEADEQEARPIAAGLTFPLARDGLAAVTIVTGAPADKAVLELIAL